MVVPPNGWFMRGDPSKMDGNWGYPHDLRKPPSVPTISASLDT